MVSSYRDLVHTHQLPGESLGSPRAVPGESLGSPWGVGDSPLNSPGTHDRDSLGEFVGEKSTRESSNNI